MRVMFKRGFVFVIVLFLLINFLYAADYYVATTGSNVTGNGNSTNPWRTIQYAINNVSTGDTIHVANGTYTENIDVNKSVNIIGDGYINTTVNATLSGDHVFDVSANSVNISGFTVTGATDNQKAGVYIYKQSESQQCYGVAGCSEHVEQEPCEGAKCSWGYEPLSVENCSLINMTFSNNFHGIKLTLLADNNEMSNCNSSDNNVVGYGFSIGGDNNTLTNNIANSNYVGFLLSGNSNILTNNTAKLNNNYGYQVTGSNNLLDNNIATSNWRYGIYLSSNINNLTNNTIFNNKQDLYLGTNCNYLSNKFSHNIYNRMINFSGSDRDKSLNDVINFNVSMFYPNSSSCPNCDYNITTRPIETVSTSKSGNNISGNFTVTKLGIYSLIVNITDENNNTAKRKYTFFIDASGSTTTKYYLRDVDPTHGQPVDTPGFHDDCAVMLLTAPTETEWWRCGWWIQNSIDELPNYRLGILEDIKTYFWYNTSVNGYIGVQQLGDYGVDIDHNETIPLSADYSWINRNFTDVNWSMEYSWHWYQLTLKLVAQNDNPRWMTNTSQPSYVNFTYRYTKTPAIKSISNEEIIILSATSPATNTNNASIVLDGTGTTNLTVQMPSPCTNSIYSTHYDNINCSSNSNCSVTQSNGELIFNLTLGSEHTLDIGLDNPIVTLNSPTNNSEHTVSHVLLNITVTDPNSDNTTIWFFGNGTLINTTENVVSGSSVTHNWTNLGNSNYNWSIIAGDGNYNTSSSTYFFTIPEEETPSSGSSWRERITKHTQTELEKSWRNINKDQTYEWDIKDFKVVDTITFIPKQKSSNAKINIKLLNKKPTGIQRPENTYQYLNISTKNLEVKQANISFKVNRSWKDNNPGKVILSRYNNKWQDLETRYIKGDKNYKYYKATTSGFSYFAIKTQESIQEEITEEAIEEEVIKETIKKTSKTTLIILISILSLIIIVFFIQKKYLKKRKKI